MIIRTALTTKIHWFIMEVILETDSCRPERKPELEQFVQDDLELENLKQIANGIRSNTRYGMVPTWIFELEECGAKLSARLKESSLFLDNTGDSKKTHPELEKLRNAIVKIGGLCASGGFALSREAIYGILKSAISDLEEYHRGCQ